MPGPDYESKFNPKPNLSKCLQRAAVVPYLTATIDWHSRCIVGWEPDDTLDTRACIEACKKAFRVARPEILNSDQGCQFIIKILNFCLEN